ncbi:DNA damage-binding protein 1a [Smittium culicis]|uniref:DNA damage-binding protein 1a n=1 Tax=Smittium culicis TaxID=133412 RepID=A0A1R1YCA3_9FUNG|nr:DNA damage-binding protein 1a [Smittium culicis]
MPGSLNYQIITTVNKPTSVYSSLKGNFSAPDKVSLVLAKCNRLEIYRLSGDSLVLLGEHILHGRVISINKIRFNSSNLDSIIALTDKKQFGIWSWNSNIGVFEVEFLDSIESKIERPLETTSMLAVDPYGRGFAMLSFQGSIHLVCSLDTSSDNNSNPIPPSNHNPKKKFKPSNLTNGSIGNLSKIPKLRWKNGKEKFMQDSKFFSKPVLCRIEELKILDIKFLYEKKIPVIAILYEDSSLSKHVKTYRITISKPHPNSTRVNAKLDLYWQQRNVHISSSIIQPSPLGGLVVIGSGAILTINHNGISNSKVKINPFNHSYLENSQIFSSTWVNEEDLDNDYTLKKNSSLNINYDSNSTNNKGKGPANNNKPERLLFGDDNGILWLLLINRLNNFQFDESRIERLGEIPIPMTISYLRDGVLFIGSHYNDSRLVKLHANQISTTLDPWNKIEQKKNEFSFIENLQVINNLAPITDMCLIRDKLLTSNDINKIDELSTSIPYPDESNFSQNLNFNVGERLITCSGARSKPSLRVIRNGIGIKKMFSCTTRSATNIFSAAISDSEIISPDSFKIILFLSFPNSTAILDVNISKFSSNKEISLSEFAFTPSKLLHNSLKSPTIYAANSKRSNTLIFVTKYQVSLLYKTSLKLVDHWLLQDSADFNESVPITCAASYDDNLVISLRGGIIIHFILENNDEGNGVPKLVKTNEIVVPYEVSCLTINDPFLSKNKNFDNNTNTQIGPILAVGLWGLPDIFIYNLTSFQCIFELSVNQSNSTNKHNPISLNNTIPAKKDPFLPINENSITSRNLHKLIPESINKPDNLKSSSLVRSLLIVRFENNPYLLVGLSNGCLVHYQLSNSNFDAQAAGSRSIKTFNMKKIYLGSFPIKLTRFQENSQDHVFLVTDKPAVMYSQNSKPMLSYVNFNNISSIFPLIPSILQDNPFLNKSLNGLMCVLEFNSLSITKFESVQKLHFDTIPLPPWESPYKITHHYQERVVAVCTIALSSKDLNLEAQFSGNYNDFPRDFEKGKISILDDTAFSTLTNMYLKPYELPESIQSLSLALLPKNYISQSDTVTKNKNFDYNEFTSQMDFSADSLPTAIDIIVLGTSITLPEEDDATRGAIYFLQYDRRLNSLTELFKIDTDGGVYSLVSFKGMLAASVNNKVVLYGLRDVKYSGAEKAEMKRLGDSSNLKENRPLQSIKMEVLSIEPTHVVSLHLATPPKNSNIPTLNNPRDTLSPNLTNNDFLGVGDLMSGVSVIQHKYLKIAEPGFMKPYKGRKGDDDADADFPDESLFSVGKSGFPDSKSEDSNIKNGKFHLKRNDKSRPGNVEIFQNHIEEVSREYFSSWVTSLACTVPQNRKRNINNLQSSKKDRLYSSKETKTTSKEDIFLRYLVAENGLNLYSLTYNLPSSPKEQNKPSSPNNIEIDQLQISGNNRDSVDLNNNNEHGGNSAEDVSSESKNSLLLTGRYHLGDMVNIITSGCLVMESSYSESENFIPELLIGTISGAIYMSVDVLESKIGRILDRLQINMGVLGPASFAGYPVYSHTSSSNSQLYSSISMSSFLDFDVAKNADLSIQSNLNLNDNEKTISSVLHSRQRSFLKSPMAKWSHAKFRTFSNLNRSSRPFGFIDGDLILLFLDYSPELQRFVFSGSSSYTEKSISKSG